MKINWKVRFKHKPFLIALFSAFLILAQQLAAAFGYGLTEVFTEQVTGIFNSVLGILVLLGVVIDPITDGVSDSEQGMKYTYPKKDVDGRW